MSMLLNSYYVGMILMKDTDDGPSTSGSSQALPEYYNAIKALDSLDKKDIQEAGPCLAGFCRPWAGGRSGAGWGVYQRAGTGMKFQAF